nr:MAG TPA: hypothetical protein [Caudoviricetes sp.]
MQSFLQIKHERNIFFSTNKHRTNTIYGYYHNQKVTKR